MAKALLKYVTTQMKLKKPLTVGDRTMEQGGTIIQCDDPQALGDTSFDLDLMVPQKSKFLLRKMIHLAQQEDPDSAMFFT
eukprot:10212093-Karenia_brevis.AAC.1